MRQCHLNRILPRHPPLQHLRQQLLLAALLRVRRQTALDVGAVGRSCGEQLRRPGGCSERCCRGRSRGRAGREAGRRAPQSGWWTHRPRRAHSVGMIVVGTFDRRHRNDAAELLTTVISQPVTTCYKPVTLVAPLGGKEYCGNPRLRAKHEARNKPNGTRQVCVLLRLETASAPRETASPTRLCKESSLQGARARRHTRPPREGRQRTERASAHSFLNANFIVGTAPLP